MESDGATLKSQNYRKLDSSEFPQIIDYVYLIFPPVNRHTYSAHAPSCPQNRP